MAAGADAAPPPPPGMIGALLRRFHGVPPHQVAVRALRRLRRAADEARARRRDRRRCTHPLRGVPSGPLLRYVPAVDPGLLRPWGGEVAALAALYREHRFDLLGSGGVRVAHGMECRGVEGHRYEPGPPVHADAAGAWLAGRVGAANLDHARRVWALVDDGYAPIDWQLDFKSGYRWDERTWYRDVAFGRLPGVDVKVPWELARMQHLPMLAWAHALARAGAEGMEPAEAYAREFRNQVLDFIAANPPRFGVNWVTAMDVAIRVVSWLVAYDLFRAHGAVFDAPFEAELARSVYAHGAHVAANLEWSAGVRGNHYLADVAGLLFIAAYLPRTGETDAWLAFAAQELAAEVEHQFTPDGAGFEASVCYHRLSAEMVAYGTALLLGLPAQKRAALAEYDARALRTTPPLRPGPARWFRLSAAGEVQVPPAFVERVRRMAEFTAHVTRPDGRVAQVGDNDSGRFLKLRPVHHALTVGEARRRYANLDGYRALPDGAAYLDEDFLDHRHLCAAIGALFAGDGGADGEPLEAALVRALAGGTLPGPPPGTESAAERARVGTEADWTRILAALEGDGGLTRVEQRFEVGDGGAQPLALYAYPGFGLYILRAPGVFLSLRCGDVGVGGLGPHAHNDQLSMELVVDGRDVARDPGTYLYTPLTARRNEYRSVRAHAAPRVDGREPGRLDLDPFRLDAAGRGECLYFGPRGFIGLHRGFGAPVYRVVRVDANTIHVNDYGTGLSAAPAEPPPFSPGYGKRHA